MQKSTESPRSSGTTGLRPLARVLESTTGQRHGEHGSVVPSNTEVPLPPAIVEAAQRADPRAVDDSLLAALPPTLRRLTSLTYTSDNERNGVQVRDIASVSTEELRSALALVGRCLKPTPAKFIVEQMAACDLVTKARAEHEGDTAARAAIFAEDLAEFPADVVAEAFRYWRRTEKWSPTVSDIRERCWRKASVRVMAKFRIEDELRRRTA